MRTEVPREAILLGVGLFLVVASGNILTPLLPLVQREFAIDYATAGALVSAFGFARLALDLPGGFLERRFGARRLAAGGFVLLIAGSLLAALGPTFEPVVVGRIGMGLGTSLIGLVVLTTLSDMAPPGARTRVLTVYSMSNNSAIGLFPIVGGVIGELAGWRATMVVCAILGCFSAVMLARLLPHSAGKVEAAKSESAPQSSFVLDRRMGFAIAAIYFGCMVNMLNRHGFRNTALPLFAADRLGLDAVAIASGIALMSAVSLAIAIPGGLIADRWSKRGVICLGFIVLAIGDMAFLGATDYLTFMLAAFVLGLGDFFAASQTAALTETVPPSWRSRALGAFRFSVDLGAAIGPILLAGLLQFAGYEPMIFCAAGLLLLASAVAWLGAVAASSPRPARA